MYALTIAGDSRILSATYAEFTTADKVLIAKLPDTPSSNIVDYKYINGEFVYAPLPKPEPPAPTQTTEERIKTLEAKNEALTISNQNLEDCIVEMAGKVYA